LNFMEKWLLHGGYYTFFLLLAGGWLFYLIKAIPSLWAGVLGLSRRTKILLLFILLLGIAIRLLASRELQIYYDEFYYLSCGENLKNCGLASYFWHTPQGINLSFPHFYPPYPQGWPALLSFWFRFFTPGLETARNLNLFFSSLSILGIFWLSFLLWQSEIGALFSTLLLALLPAAVKLTPSGAAEISSFFWLILSGIFLLNALRQKQKQSSYLAILTYGLFLQMRPENLLTLPLFLLAGFSLFNMAGILYLGLGILPIALIFYLSFSIPELKNNFLPIPRPGIPSLKAQFFANLKNNLEFFFISPKNPVILTLGALASWFNLKFASNRETKITWFLWGWFLLFFVFYLPYPFGDFNCVYSLDSWRSSLNLYLPLILLFAGGIKLAENLSWKRLFYGLLGLLILINFLGQTAFIYRHHPRQNDCIALESLKSLLPRNSTLIVDDPDQALLLHYTSGLNISLLKPREFFTTSHRTYLLTDNLDLDFWKNYVITYLRTIKTSDKKLDLFKVDKK